MAPSAVSDDPYFTLSWLRDADDDVTTPLTDNARQRGSSNVPQYSQHGYHRKTWFTLTRMIAFNEQKSFAVIRFFFQGALVGILVRRGGRSACM